MKPLMHPTQNVLDALLPMEMVVKRHALALNAIRVQLPLTGIHLKQSVMIVEMDAIFAQATQIAQNAQLITYCLTMANAKHVLRRKTALSAQLDARRVLGHLHQRKLNAPNVLVLFTQHHQLM